MAYSDEVLADSPVGYWPLNQAAGTTTGIDASGNGRTLTIDGTYTFGNPAVLKDRPDTSYNQTLDALLYSLDTTWLPTGDFTIEAWVKPDRQAILTIASQYQTYPSDALWALRVDNGYPTFYLWRSDTTYAVVQTANPIPANVGFHLAATFDGSVGRMYVDGVLVGATAPLTQEAANPFFRIGASGLGEYWRGNLAHVALYDHALTADRVTVHARNGSTWADVVAALSPEVWYRAGLLDSTSTALDASGHDRHGSYVGATRIVGQVGGLTYDPDGAAYVAGNGQITHTHDTWMDGPVTCLAIYRPDSVSGNQTLMGIDDSGDPSVLAWRVRMLGDQIQGFYNGDPTGIVTPAGTLAAGGLYLIAYSLDTAHEQIWVNGVKVAEAAGPATVPVRTGPLRFGALIPGAPESYAGLLDEAILVGRALTPAEHASLYSAMIGESSSPEPQTVTLARIDETDSLATITPHVGSPAEPQTVLLGRIDETDTARGITVVGGLVPTTVDFAGTTQVVDVSSGGGALSTPVPIVLTIPDPQLDRAPTSVVVYVFGVPLHTDVQLSIDGALVKTLNQGTSIAPLGPVSLEVGIDPNTSAYYTQGDHTVTAHVAGSPSSSATFNLANPAPAAWVTGTDVDPISVPGTAVGPDRNGFVVHRWVFQDLMPSGLGSYVLPFNPQSMSPLPIEKTNLDAVHTTGVNGRFHVTDAIEQPHPFSFQGVVLDTQLELRQKLLAYGELNRRWYLIDHRQRAWVVTFLSVELAPQKRDRDNVQADQRHTYVVNCVIYSADWKTPL